jgi:hypothetical protein
MYAAEYQPTSGATQVPDNMPIILVGAITGEVVFCSVCMFWVNAAAGAQIRGVHREWATGLPSC